MNTEDLNFEDLQLGSDDSVEGVDAAAPPAQFMSSAPITEDLSPGTFDFAISASEVVMGEQIGSGMQGKVFRGKLHGKDVAVKVLPPKFMDAKAMSLFRKEVEILGQLRHPNVVLFMGVCPDPGQQMIVTELLGRGSVLDIIKTRPSELPFERRMQIAKEAAMGMNWLHCCRPPILHLDLKCGNLLVSDDWTVKVADFGLSRFNPLGLKSGMMGSPAFMSPEMLMGQDYDEKTDVYSFGMLLWELLTLHTPFHNEFKSLEELRAAVGRGGRRPLIPSDIPQRLQQLLRELWHEVPSRRPSFQRILDDRVFDKVVVEASISHKSGVDFWLRQLLDKERVTWDIFEDAFFAFFKIPPAMRVHAPPTEQTKMFFVRELVVDPTSGAVTMQRFSQFLATVGPLVETVYLEAEKLYTLGYFHGWMSTRNAEAVLASSKPGAYLVRLSSSEPGSFTLSAKTKQGQVAHYRMHHSSANGESVALGDASFPNVAAAIKAHVRKYFLKFPIMHEPTHNRIFIKPIV